MLKIGGKEVIYSKTFLMAQGEDVTLAPPEVIARTIKVEASSIVSTVQIGQKIVAVTDSGNQVTIAVPFVDGGSFSFDIANLQLNTLKGPLTCRISGQSFGAHMLVHFDLHEGRYDNYTGD